MWKNEPLIGLVDKIVWGQGGLIFIRFIPRTGNPDCVRKVSSRFLFEFFENGGNAATGVKDIIHDKEVIGVIGTINNILKSVYPDFLVLLVDSVIRAGSNRDVVTL